MKYIIVAQKDHYCDSCECDSDCTIEYEHIITHTLDTLEDAREIKDQCDKFWRVGTPIIYQQVE